MGTLSFPNLSLLMLFQNLEIWNKRLLFGGLSNKSSFFFMGHPVHHKTRAVNSPFLAGRLPVIEAISLSPYFKINLPVFENNQFLNIKVYENDMRKNSLFSVTNFLGSLEIYT